MGQGFDKDTIRLIMDAWRDSTKKSYSNYLYKWATFCLENGVELLSPTLPQACKFLRVLSARGLGYGGLNTARSALSTILPRFEGHSFGSHPIVCWLVKGGYERNPPRPRYSEFWDVNRVFTLFKEWGQNSDLTLKRLSLKVAVLLLLVSSQRGQTVVNLTTENLEIGDNLVFKMKVLLKHNRIGDPLDTLLFKPFDQCKRLCVVRAVKAYLQRTKEKRRNTQLLLSFVSPHAPISRDTLSRWTICVLGLAGIDTTKYKCHSTRGASTSAAKRLGVPVTMILRHANWRSATSFAKYYDKRLDGDASAVGQALLINA